MWDISHLRMATKTKTSLHFCSQPEGHTGLVPFGVYIWSNSVQSPERAMPGSEGWESLSSAISELQLHLILLIISHMNTLPALSCTPPRVAPECGHQSTACGSFVCHPALSDPAQPLSSLLPSPKSCSPEEEGESKGAL